MKRSVFCVMALLIALLGSGCSGSFVPRDFEPPVSLIHELFVLKPLQAADAEKDYEAVMESIEVIHQALLSEAWPTAAFTLQENRADLEKKEREFAAKKAFTYAILSLDGSRVLGSVYINKGRKGADAAVFFWVRKSAYDLGYDAVVEGALRAWMREAWPFEVVVFPGRDDRLGRFFSSLYTQDRPGAVIQIEMGEDGHYNEAFGLADVDQNRLLTPDAVVPIASMTKSYTAVAVMTLVEAGKLSLNDKLNRFYPNAPETVTLRHLLGNTSGIVRYNGLPEYRNYPDKPQLTLDQMVAFFIDKPLAFEPGARFQYSNSNYILLSAIIEKVSGMGYEAYVRAQILDPLGLKSTFFSAQEVSGQIPTGYRPENDGFAPAFEDTRHTYGAGMLYATASDLGAFIMGLNQHRLISKESLDLLYTEQIIHRDGRPDEYAHGFWTTTLEGEKVIKLEGHCAGFYTQAFYFTQKNLAVVVLPNRSDDPGQPDPVYMAQWIHRFVSGREVEAHRAVTLPDSVLKRYEGVYRLDADQVRQVFVRDNRLYTLRTAGQTLEAKPWFLNRFFYPNTFTSFSFETDEEGAMKMIMVDDQGRLSEAEKTVLPLRTPVAVNRRILARYVGKYERRFELFLDGGTLMFTNGFHAYPLYPQSKTVFYPWHEDSIFRLNADGSLTYAIGEFSMTVAKLK